VRPSVEKQAQDEGQQVDQRWGYPNAGIVLVVGDASSCSLYIPRSSYSIRPYAWKRGVLFSNS
jgi:hypothetical protein